MQIVHTNKMHINIMEAENGCPKQAGLGV